MYHYLKSYIQEVDEILKKTNRLDDMIIERHLVKIRFFQHERLIHLLVTLFYGLFLIGSMFFVTIHPIFVILPFLMICFLIPYVIHYFHLENGVQYLYRQYDKMIQNKK